MSVGEPFNIYQEQLTSLYRGLALWRPNPVEDAYYDQVSVGDVGYISEGAFIRIFNVTLPWNDESNRRLGEPEHYNFLTLTGTRIDRETFGQVDYYSRGVTIEGNAGNRQASSPEQWVMILSLTASTQFVYILTETKASRISAGVVEHFCPFLTEAVTKLLFKERCSTNTSEIM
jgi:hypothetical protein